MPFDLGFELRRLLGNYVAHEGCSRRSALRDLLTEVSHLCDAEGYDVDALFDAAVETAREERA